MPLRAQGEVLIQHKRFAEAVPLLERALAIRIAAKLSASELGDARFSLAKAIAADPSQRERARTLATTALAEHEKAGNKSEVATVRAWLASH